MKLRTRLVLAAVVILGVVLAGAVLILQNQERYLVQQVDDQLFAARPFVRPPQTSSIDPNPPGDDGPGLPGAPVSDLYIGRVVDGELETVLQGQLLDDVPALESADLERATRGPVTTDSEDGTTRFRVLALPSAYGSEVTVVGLPLEEVDRSIARLRLGLFAGAAGIAATLFLVIWWVERLGLRPVARVTEVAEAIAAGDRTRRVEEVDARTEAGRLAASFNVMLDERDAGEQRLRRFVSDASHELRTPLTSIRGYLDLYREGGFRGAGQLDDAVRRMSHESARMQTLVEDLLLLAQLDEQVPLRDEAVDLAQVLRDAASDARAVQPDRDIDVDVDPSLVVTGDPQRLQQVLAILLSNAVTHTPPDARIRLDGHRTDGLARLVVSDEGPGLGPEDAEHVFERFYRGDRSRTRTTGGSGLGLAIAKSVVEAHAGEIRLDTRPGGGCAFTIDLPMDGRVHRVDDTDG